MKGREHTDQRPEDVEVAMVFRAGGAAGLEPEHREQQQRNEQQTVHTVGKLTRTPALAYHRAPA